jgi:hypothetical protein
VPEQTHTQTPLFSPEELAGRAQIVFIDNHDLLALSTDHFRETGENYPEWAATDPSSAFDALRTQIANRRHAGNLGAVALSMGLEAHYSDPTTISVQIQRPPSIRQKLTGRKSSDVMARSEEIARFHFGQNESRE